MVSSGQNEKPTSLGYAGRRTGSDPPSEGIHRISCGYEIPSFEGIMSHYHISGDRFLGMGQSLRFLGG